MNKKNLALVGILVLVVAVVGVLLAAKRTNKSSPLTKSNSSATPVQNNGQTQLSLKYSDLQAHYPPEPDACLATSDDPALKLDATDQAGIVNAVVGTVIDIPAGTNVDAHIKSYDKTTATGTSIYESTFGSYNFTAIKTNNGQGNWIVTKFVACKK